MLIMIRSPRAAVHASGDWAIVQKACLSLPLRQVSAEQGAMSYYQRHVFFCINQREGGETCCANCGSPEMRDYVKARIKEMGLAGPGKVRINAAGCLDRCEEGPCVVIYPEAVWYTYVDREDLEEIIEEHLLHGRIVERLRI